MANYDRLNNTGLVTLLTRLAQVIEPAISILPISKGGTGNSSGYIRTGIKSNTTAATGSTIEGINNEVSGNNGTYSHAEGSYNTVSGMYSHAEGYNNNISGDNSHVEGSYNTVTGDNSHASGYTVTSGYDYQTVIGRFNNNKSTTLFEVGNGTGNGSTPNKNALEVYADGHINVNGDYYQNGTKVTFGGSGTVTSVSTGTGLTGGPITSSGTISLETTGPGSGTSGSTSNTSETYGTTTLTVPYVTTDAYGRVSARGTTSNTLRNSIPVSVNGTVSYSNNYITVSSTDLTAGSSSLTTGAIYMVYE